MLFKHEQTFLVEMNDLLSLMVDHYMFKESSDYLRDHEAIDRFVKFVVNENNEAIDEPRKNGRTYRQASKYP